MSEEDNSKKSEESKDELKEDLSKADKPMHNRHFKEMETKKELSLASLVPIYTAGAIGALLQIAGGYWDFAWHHLGLVETFSTPAHLVLYAGVAMTLLAGIIGIIKFRNLIIFAKPERMLLVGLYLLLIGGGLQLFAGGFDSWWHDSFGFDPFLLTPSHIPLIVGFLLNGIGVTIGSIRLLQSQRTGLRLGKLFGSSRWLQALVVVALATLWLDLNTIVYLVTDVNGIAYTFQLSNEFDFSEHTSPIGFVLATVTLAGTGTLVLFSAKKILRRKGAVMAVAVLSTAITAITYLGFSSLVLAGTQEGSEMGSFIPLYLSFLIPVFFFDILVKDSHRRRWIILSSALIAPFASYLDGWYSSGLWIHASEMIPLLVLPMSAAGVIAALLVPRFAKMLSTEKLYQQLKNV